MKVHLFKIEQFFKEELVLNAELRYPFALIQMKEDGSNRLQFQVQEAKCHLKLDKGHEHIIGMNCNCATFKESSACVHLVMAAWEYRKRGYPEKEKGQAKSSRIQTSHLIQSIEESGLRQFLVGYASRNTEFRQVLKLLFSHEIAPHLSYEECKEQLFKLFELFRTRLDAKKHQRTFEFYLRTYLGVAEDLLTQKDFRSAAFYVLSSWELWMEKSIHLSKIPDANSNYEQLLKVIDRIERAPLSPELYKYVFKKLQERMEEPFIQPFLAYDIPEMLADWGLISNDRYLELIIEKLSNASGRTYWVSRFFKNIEEFNDEQLAEVKRYIRPMNTDKILRKLEASKTFLNTASFFFLMETKRPFAKNHLRRMQVLIPESYAFLTQLEMLIQFEDYSQIENLLYETKYSKEEQKILQVYLQHFSVPTWVQLLIEHHIFGHKDALEQISDVDHPKEWIQLLDHLKAPQRDLILNKIETYCLEFASSHIGVRSKQHLEQIGKMLIKQGFQEEWNKIQQQIMDKYDHRRSIQSMDNPFL